MSELDPAAAFAVQPQVRDPWRRYLDGLVPLRPDLHRYCCRLAGNVWDGEDMVQDTLVRVFGLLGKTDAELRDPRAYLIRTATHLWIDRRRRRARERAWREGQGSEAREGSAQADPGQAAAVREAATSLLARLAPRERAALLLEEVFDLSLEETAGILQVSVGAVKAALHRARGRLERANPDAQPAGPTPPRELVQRFVAALAARDLEALRALCSQDLTVELVGGAQLEGFEQARSFFGHAHVVLPQLGFGEHPNWHAALYDGEPLVLGFRTLGASKGSTKCTASRRPTARSPACAATASAPTRCGFWPSSSAYVPSIAPTGARAADLARLRQPRGPLDNG